MEGQISQLSRLRAAALLALTWLPTVIWLTLRGDPAAQRVVDLTSWWCLSCGPAGTADQLQNLLLLLPLGVAAALAGWSLRSTALALFALSTAIEMLQGVANNGRDAALGDVLANGVGGLLGWWVLHLGSRRWPRMQRAAAPIGVGLFIAQLIATASLSGPSPDGPEPWQLRLRPETSSRPTYRGEIFNVTLGGRSIVTESRATVQPRDAQAIIATAHFSWDQPGDVELTPIVRLDDARHWAILAVDRRDQHLGITVRTAAGRLRLRAPTWLITVPAGTASGDTLRHALSIGRGRAMVTVATPHAADTLHFRYGAQHGWALINPFATAHGDPVDWNRWTLAWLSGWGVLLGLATMWARHPAAWLGVALAGLVLISAVAGAVAMPIECVAMLVGALAAQLTGRRFRWSANGA